MSTATQSFVPPPPQTQSFVPQPASHPYSTPYVPDYNALMQVAASKPSNTGLARDCFKIIFERVLKANIFATGQYNMYGRQMSVNFH